VSVLKSLVEMQMENTDTHQITMDEGIFGEQYEEDIIKEQIDEFFENTEISVSVGCVYIRYSE